MNELREKAKTTPNIKSEERYDRLWNNRAFTVQIQYDMHDASGNKPRRHL